MMSFATTTLGPIDGHGVVPSTGGTPGSDEPSDFGRLILLMRSNEQLTDELRTARLRAVEARAYLARPEANAALGAARLAQMLGRRSALLARLRANRIEATAILARHAGR